MTTVIHEKRIKTWRGLITFLEPFLRRRSWVFRGHGDAAWRLQTSLEREFGSAGEWVERDLLERFLRRAGRYLRPNETPLDDDIAAWLGLIQHYGGPTRLLDVTRSPYVALHFAFESSGAQDRAVWAIDSGWCQRECARIMAKGEGATENAMVARLVHSQRQLVGSLAWDIHADMPAFQEFTGVFPVDPWKPDARQSAQQALFLCSADPERSFDDNLDAHQPGRGPAVYRLTMAARLREEFLHRLAAMNISAATLFPDLMGLARSLRTAPFGMPFKLKRTANTQARAKRGAGRAMT